MNVDVPTEITVRLRADPGELETLMDEVHGFSEDAGLPPRAAGRVALVVEELVSNTIKYGYDTPGAGTIQVRIRLAPDRVELTLDDDGRPFDPFAPAEPALDLPVEDRPIGGLGLHLVRSTTQAQSYRRTRAGNRVALAVALDG